VNIIEAMDDAKLFAPWFKKHWLRSDSWSSWNIFLEALYSLPMNAEEFEVYCRHTGRNSPPSKPFHKAWLICGRRSGKSRIAALIAVFNALFREHATLQRGEIGVIPVIASDRVQAGVIFGCVLNFFRDSALLATMVVAETKDSIELNNNAYRRSAVLVRQMSSFATMGHLLAALLLAA
jgi:hypothetical protein